MRMNLQRSREGIGTILPINMALSMYVCDKNSKFLFLYPFYHAIICLPKSSNNPSSDIDRAFLALDRMIISCFALLMCLVGAEEYEKNRVAAMPMGIPPQGSMGTNGIAIGQRLPPQRPINAGPLEALPKPPIRPKQSGRWWPGAVPNKTTSTTAGPQVLVATIMTTITNYSTIYSTTTNNIYQTLTSFRTESTTITRHSTRTIQLTTTETTKTTITRTSTETSTTVEYSLVPFTITEVETKTETTESLTISTYVVPASTIHSTVWKTTTPPASTLVITEFMQALIDTTVTEYATITQTATVEVAPTEVDEALAHMLKPGMN